MTRIVILCDIWYSVTNISTLVLRRIVSRLTWKRSLTMNGALNILAIVGSGTQFGCYYFAS